MYKINLNKFNSKTERISLDNFIMKLNKNFFFANKYFVRNIQNVKIVKELC